MSARSAPADLQQPPAPRRITRRALARAAAAGATLLWGRAPARAAARWWSSLVFGVLENRAYSTVETLPSHVRLAREGAVLSNYDAIGHPSGPNYRAMISGEAWGTGEIVDAFHPSVASAAAALVPPVPTYVYHLAGTIAARHNPFVDLHAPLAAQRRGFDVFRRDLAGGLPPAALVYVGWDDDNDLHNGNFSLADRNVTNLLDALTESRWFTTPDGSGRYPALFLTYDENDGRAGNRVFAAWWGRGVSRGLTSPRHHTHYGFCRTMTDNLGLDPLGRGADEPPIDEVWIR